MKIGIVFDLKEDYGICDNMDYYDFCFLSEAEAAYNNLTLLGYDVEYLGNPSELLKRIKNNSLNYDIIYNITEGYKSRNREGLVPAICESFCIPYTGSDSFALSLSLHKFQMACFLEKSGISIPQSFIYTPYLDDTHKFVDIILTNGLNFPIVLKPNHEGSSMGLKMALDKSQLIKEIEYLANRFSQEVLVQEYIQGIELSTCILGTGTSSYVYSNVEYRNVNGEPIDLFTKQLKITGNHIMLSPILEPNIIKEMEDKSLFIHRITGINDISRVDWKYDDNRKKLFFMELTPLPDLSEGTEFDWAAKQNRHSYSFVFSEIIKSATSRYNLKV